DQKFTAANYSVAITWAQIAIMPTNRAKEVSVAASSTTARTMALTPDLRTGREHSSCYVPESSGRFQRLRPLAVDPQSPACRTVGRGPAAGDKDRYREETMHPSLLRLTLAAAWMALMTCAAAAQDALKVAIGQRGGWEQCVSELGQNAGIFKKHGLTLD